MRRITLLAVALSLTCLTHAQTRVNTVQANLQAATAHFNPYNAHRQFDPRLLDRAARSNHAPFKVSSTRRAEADANVDSTFVVAQSFYKDTYYFHPEGGDVKTYNLRFKREGDKVTFYNLFNLAANSSEWSVEADNAVVGAYDTTTGTITIPTDTLFSNATIAGTSDNGFYNLALFSGTMQTDGSMKPDMKLVLNVTDDFRTITTTQNFGLMQFSYRNAKYGFKDVYRTFKAYTQTEDPEIVTFANQDDVIDLGSTFAGDSLSGSVTIMNLGKTAGTVSLELDDEDGAFSMPETTLTVAPLASVNIPVSFTATEEKDYEAFLTVNEDHSDPVLFQLAAHIIPQPSFSAIIKNGDFTSETLIDQPWTLDTLENGQVVAASKALQSENSKSMLTFTFTVPEGKMGNVSWKGMSNNTYWGRGTGKYFLDDMTTPLFETSDPNVSLDNTLQVAPGQHKLRFEYDMDWYSGIEDDRMYIYDLNLETGELADDSASVVTDSVMLDNGVLKTGGRVTRQGNIVLLNEGKNDLTLNSITSTDSHLTAATEVEPAATKARLVIPVTFTTDKAGNFATDFTINTSAGTFHSHVSTKVIDAPDFSQIVTDPGEGVEWSWTTDSIYPFCVADGKAFNLNSGKSVNGTEESWMEATINVPENKIATIGWDGMLYGTPDDVDNYYNLNFAGFVIDNVSASGSGIGTANADEMFDNTRALQLLPGKHTVRFSYTKNTPEVYGQDRLEISNMRLTLTDAKPLAASLSQSTVAFDSVYVNRSNVVNIQVINNGYNTLKIDSLAADAPFKASLVKLDFWTPAQDTAAYGASIPVELTFAPATKGIYSGKAHIYTNAGMLEVSLTGRTKEDDGLLFVGDMEDEAAGWTYSNADMYGWQIGQGSELLPAHSGSRFLRSYSYDYLFQGPITPDNLAVTPTITIPADGAVLSFFVSPSSSYNFAEHYAVYVTEQNADQADSIKTETPVMEETISATATTDEKGWIGHTLSLNPWAGKTVHIAFRHYDCSGQLALLLDDVYVLTNQRAERDGIVTDGISNVSVKTTAATTVYNVNGMRTNGLQKGLNIVRTQQADGSVKTQKIVIR